MTAEMCVLLTSALAMGHMRTRVGGHKLKQEVPPEHLKTWMFILNIHLFSL